MSISQSPCPANSVIYNNTQCACSPGYLFNLTSKSCILFDLSPSQWVLESGVDNSFSLPDTIISFDQIKKFTQSQAVFLQATAVMLLSWLLFCCFVRFGKLGDGRNHWFRVRWWISRLDVCFATRHWLDDQKVVKKRKTELGGAFSIASWILFIGLFATLLYQIIAKNKIEVHNVRATNAPDLVSFVNDLEFNITTVSNMSCTQLRGLGTLLMGKPGIIGYRGADLSRFANYTCLNTVSGPTINLRCSNCPLVWDNVYISWYFVDIPNQPASAVGFQFNLTAKNSAHEGHVSLVSGVVKNGSKVDEKPITFRGVDTNILQFNLFPRVYHNLHNMKLVQPLFHEFLPGSFISDANEFRSSLQNSSTGLVNTTLFINFLSDYIVEIDDQKILGPVGFLADLGGLFCISIGIFYYLLVQGDLTDLGFASSLVKAYDEYMKLKQIDWIKRLRIEDQTLRNIRRRRKAQDHWEKLRKYVIYTWGCKKLQEKYMVATDEGCCTSSMSMSNLFRTRKSSHKKRAKEISLHTISFDKGDFSPKEKHSNAYRTINASPRAQVDINNGIAPPPALPDFRGNSADGISDIQKSLQSLYEYNMMLRDKLVATQSRLDSLTTKSSIS